MRKPKHSDLAELDKQTCTTFLGIDGITDCDVFLKSCGVSEEEINEWEREGIEKPCLAHWYHMQGVQEAAQKRAELSKLFPLASEFTQKPIEWLIPHWIPRGEIVTFFGDGGSGKSRATLDIIAKLSSGRETLLDKDATARRLPMNILYCNQEDDTERVTKERLSVAGADESRIRIPRLDVIDETICIGSALFEEVIKNTDFFSPQIVVIDPLQSFLPVETDLNDKADMRKVMNALSSLAHNYGVTFFIVCHTNKRSGASGRASIANSTEIWDASRIVISVGKTPNGGYISMEKCNYGKFPDTVLFSIDDDGIHKTGTTYKRQADFVSEIPSKAGRPATTREDCAQALQDLLKGNGGYMETSDLDDALTDKGFSSATIRRAKESLGGAIRTESSGYGKDKQYITYLTSMFGFSGE